MGRSIAQGAVFEIGHGGAKSLIEGENMYSMRGFGDSVLFAGVLGGVSKMLAGSSKLAQWSQTGNGLVQFSKGAIVDGAALNVAGVTSKLAFDDKFSYSPEELAQAFVMAGLFRGAGKAAGAVASKFKVSRDADGGLRVEPQLPPPGSMPVPVNTQAATTAYAPVQNQPINSVPGSRKQSSPDIVVKDKDGTVLQTTAESASLRKPFEVTTSKTEGNKIQNQSPSTGEYAQKPTGVNNYTPATDV